MGDGLVAPTRWGCVKKRERESARTTLDSSASVAEPSALGSPAGCCCCGRSAGVREHRGTSCPLCLVLRPRRYSFCLVTTTVTEISSESHSTHIFWCGQSPKYVSPAFLDRLLPLPRPEATNRLRKSGSDTGGEFARPPVSRVATQR